MIKSCDDLVREVLLGKTPRKLPPDIVRRAKRKLEFLNAATELAFLQSIPGNHLKTLKGTKTTLHSMRINDQWRITFTWTGADAENVAIVDYH
ncbi:MAG: type II toxin-antitoxin system RelE/ParE family toxin [Opitutaceae bacterium]|jgi:proteic killer suppression protein|nr:type II toxin-antitoxin system RelE/ParE family toxin [Opitutaceae bacterium]